MGSVGYECGAVLFARKPRRKQREKQTEQPVSSGRTKLADRTQRRDNVRRRPYAYERGKPPGERERKSYLIGTRGRLASVISARPSRGDAVRLRQSVRVSISSSSMRSYRARLFVRFVILIRAIHPPFSGALRLNTTLGQSRR